MPDPEQAAQGVANLLHALGAFNPDPGLRGVQDLNPQQSQGAIFTPPTTGGGPQLPPNFAAYLSQQQAQQGQPNGNLGNANPGDGQAFGYPAGQQYGVNSGFGGARGHPGIDLAFPDHTTVLSATAGTVVEAVNSDNPSAYNVVKVQAPDGHIATEYGHLSDVYVNVGDQVQEGQPLGLSGGAPGERGTYNSSGPHLHFQVDQDGVPVDPAPFLAGAHPIIGTPSGGQDLKAQTQGTMLQYVPPDPADVGQAQGESIMSLLQGGGGVAPPRGHNIEIPAPTQPNPAQIVGPRENQPGGISGSWAQDILEGIGAPVNDNTIRVMNAWMALEGGLNHNNPLNTTLDRPGAGIWNSVGVRSYVDYNQGLDATISTLMQQNMSGIVAALRAGGSVADMARAIGYSPWIGYNPAAQQSYYAALMRVLGG